MHALYPTKTIIRKDNAKETYGSGLLYLRPLDEHRLIDLRRRYDETADAETRTRYQMLLLSAKGQTSTQIAQTVLRSQDTVVRVLKRFITGGVEAIPRRTAPGRERTVTEVWEAELLQAADLDAETQGRSTSPLRGKRLRVEVLLAGATAPDPLPVHDLVEADL